MSKKLYTHQGGSTPNISVCHVTHDEGHYSIEASDFKDQHDVLRFGWPNRIQYHHYTFRFLTSHFSQAPDRELESVVYITQRGMKLTVFND